MKKGRLKKAKADNISGRAELRVRRWLRAVEEQLRTQGVWCGIVV